MNYLDYTLLWKKANNQLATISRRIALVGLMIMDGETVYHLFGYLCFHL
jgi:hypothetical protein